MWFRCSRDLFSAFVRFVVRSASDPLSLDRHWRPQYLLCDPCRVHYDFIGHYETLDTDADHVLRIISRNVTKYSFSESTSRTKAVLPQLFSVVPKSDIEAVLRLYARDYALFGYAVPNITNILQKI